MAHIRKRPNRPRPYLAIWTDPSGKEVSRAFARKTDAEAHITTVEASKLNNDYVDPRKGQTLFKDYAEALVESWVDLAPATRANVRSRLNRHLLPFFGSYKLSRIDDSMLRSWVKQMADKGLDSETIKSAAQSLLKILRTAQNDRLISRAPGMPKLPRKQNRPEMCFISPGEVKQLAAAIDDRFRRLIFTAAYTGARWGELAGLKVGRLDLDGGRLHIVEALSEVNGYLHTKEPKTGKARTLDLPPFLVEMLREQMYLYPSREGYVFSSAQGGPLRRNFYPRHFKPAVLRAGLNPKLRFHDLRHSAASLLISQGANVKEIQEQLGHSSSRLTLDRYGHLFEGLTKRLQAGLQAAFESTDGPGTDQERTRV